MRFTTIGTGTIALTGERCCAGYLVEHDDVRLLIDCGNGVARRMVERGLPWKTITHVAFTHFHLDHHADFPTLVFAWKYGDLPARSAPLQVIGPLGTRTLLEGLASAYGAWLLDPGFAISITEMEPVAELPITDGLRLRTQKVPHTEESVAYSIELGGRRIVYSGDTGYDESFAGWAEGCDLLVCECSLPASMAIPSHLTPEQCGQIAARARPGHLALTHFYPPVEHVDIPALVREQYDGPLTLAYDGWTFEFEAT